MSQAPHQTKFRWTENLTCRFIQLRKENGKLFTGQKYSAQAGWECILQQMREEFPTIMANVHYRVLKKKWSNLLQQYKPILLLCICYSDLLKELKNPVHGDRNKADDVSWPFYSAIDEVLGHGGGTPNNEEYIDPHEFLCVSVTPEEPTSSVDALPAESNPEIERRTSLLSDQRLRPFDGDLGLIQLEEFPNRHLTRQPVKAQRRKRDATGSLISRLPRATELSIEKVTSEADCSKDLPKEAARNNVLVVVGSTRKKGQPGTARNVDEERPRKLRRARVPCHEDHESRIDRRIEEIFEYTKRRDEENRCMMARIMHAVETIANKL